MRSYLSIAVCAASALVFALAPMSAAQAKSVGGCPPAGDFELVTVESLGITPDMASGIASLDGNGDGMTCIRFLTTSENSNSPIGIFRDNTVGTTR
jgi:hypothetical protein